MLIMRSTLLDVSVTRWHAQESDVMQEASPLMR